MQNGRSPIRISLPVKSGSALLLLARLLIGASFPCWFASVRVCAPMTDCIMALQISINGQVHNVGTVIRVSNHYMVGIVLGILAALVAGAALAFAVMKHLRKKKKGRPRGP